MPKYQETRRVAFDAIRPDLQRIVGQGIGASDDSNAIAFLVSQLAYTEAQTFEKLYTPMQFEELLPIDYSAGEWVDSIRYELYDYAGQGKRTSGKGRDINLVDVAYGQKSFPVVNGDIGYDFTQEELRRTAYLRRPLPTARQQAAVEGFRRHLNSVALYGEQNLTGLFNNPYIPQGNAPTGNWLNVNTTPAQILADINTLITNVWTNTQYNDLPTNILIAPQRYAFISSTARSSNSDKTILQYVKENNIAKVERGVDIKFQPGYGLDTGGAGSTARMIGYVKSPLRLTMHVPLSLRFLAPQPVGLAVQVPGEYKYSGVEVRYPKSAYYMDGL
jgi:hypothetical protein